MEKNTHANASTEMSRTQVNARSQEVVVYPTTQVVATQPKIKTMRSRWNTHSMHGRDWENAIQGKGNMCCPSGCACCLSFIIPCAWIGGCKNLDESEAMTIFVNGKLAALRTEPGIFCLNPMCTSVNVITTKQQSYDLHNLKIIDKKGNPIVISAIVVYRVKNAVRATLEVENVFGYVANSATAMLKNVAARFAYETPDDSPSLKTHASLVTKEMIAALQEKVEVAGIQIVDFLINELSYAKEIAGAMLQRQQAEALIDARTLIVQGAVDIARNASEKLNASGIEMTLEEKSRMVTNIMCVICGDSNVQPIIPLG